MLMNQRILNSLVFHLLIVTLMVCFLSQKASSENLKGSTVNGTLKIINWNVLYGFNHHKSIKGAGQWIHAQQPDVIGLSRTQRDIEFPCYHEHTMKFPIHPYGKEKPSMNRPCGLQTSEFDPCQ